jgi:hypothetical protein
MPENTELAALTARVQQAAAELTIRDVGRPKLPQHLLDVAAQAGVQAFVGTIALVGQDSSGNYDVQFNDSNTNIGYSSGWPQWAFELAKTAMLASKQVVLLANGDPFGFNLVSVAILA